VIPLLSLVDRVSPGLFRRYSRLLVPMLGVLIIHRR
jgi:hypothetical protein